MNAFDLGVRATFKVKPGTDIRRFQAALRAVYNGTAEDSDVAYTLDSVESIKCGWDSEERSNSAKKRWKR
jgi:hypothetical protein